MTTVMEIHFVFEVAPTLLLLQLTENWYSDSMAAVTNKRKVLSTEEKDKVKYVN